jgi:ribosomal peptide maturation radical SAM protein 1
LKEPAVSVLIIVMPFAAIRPAMGTSLLVAHLKRLGIAARVEYLSMDFATALGAADYEYIADQAPTQSLAGDWVFAPALFGDRPAQDAAYIEAFRTRFSKFAAGDAELAVLSRARGKAASFIEHCLSKLDWTSYDLVGFTSSFTQHVAALALAKRLKAVQPHLQIVFGGANCEDVMGLALHRAFSFVDFVCSGEADISFPRLVEALSRDEDPHRIPGVISRRDGASFFRSLHPERVADLDTLPYPDFDDYFEQHARAFPRARHARGRILMESSRGCWWGQKHHCTFCGLNGNAMAFRAKSAERVLDEITALQNRYAAEHVEMVDNILDMAYLSSVLPELKRRGLRLNLFYETKANLRKDQLRLLRDAGVTAIQPGIESFSTSVLRLMRKGTSAAQNIQLLKWCSEAGIEACWNLLYGFPGEDPDQYSAMVPVIESIAHLEPPRGFGPIRLDRFSPNFSSASEFGLCNLRPDRSYTYIYDLPADQLFDLAYYFEYDYADGRDPNTYVREAVAAVRRWLNHHEPNRLVYADHGDCLAIWDLRPGASQRLMILRNDGRLTYLLCDQHRPLRSLERSFPDLSRAEIEAVLDRFIARKLMLKIDGHYLSLAVRLPAAGAARQERAAELERVVF